MISAADASDWLEGLLDEAVQEIFGQPYQTPEQLAIEIEEIGIGLYGQNLNGMEIPLIEEMAFG